MASPARTPPEAYPKTELVDRVVHALFLAAAGQEVKRNFREQAVRYLLFA
jgi:hypothetical protein